MKIGLVESSLFCLNSLDFAALAFLLCSPAFVLEIDDDDDDITDWMGM